MNGASEIAGLDLAAINLRKMFKETGKGPATLLSMTVAEFQYLFPFGTIQPTVEDKIERMVTAHANVNRERGERGQPPKWSDEFIGHLESKLNRVNHG